MVSRAHEGIWQIGQKETEGNSPPDPGGGTDSRRQMEENAGALVDLGSIQRVQRGPDTDGRTFTPGPGQHIGVERFRLLAHKLRRLRQLKPLRILVVTSSIPREGKTLVATNLASILARNSARVLLLDADLRRPGVHRMLGISSMSGLGELLESGRNLVGALRYVEPLNFYLMQAGHPAGNPIELLQRPSMSAALDAVASAFEWVVIDSPPISPFADALCLASMADAVVLVVRSGVTPGEILQQTIASLGETRIAGIVLNACDDQKQDYYYYSYYSQKTKKEKTPDGALHLGLSNGADQPKS